MNPILLDLGAVQIRWYGVLMAAAFLCGYFILSKIAKERGIAQGKIDEYVLFMFVGLIGGARLGEAMFYNPSFYLTHPLEILFIWKGGLASHGAIIGAVVATGLFCRRHKMAFYTMADMVVIPCALGAAFVRIGNFTNGEIVGRVTDVPWAMHFDGYEGLRHPSQLYESAKNLFIFAALWSLRKKKMADGMMFWLFIAMFSFLRFFVEFFKDFQGLPESAVLTMGQWLSIPFFIAACVMLWRIRRTHGKKAARARPSSEP